MSKQTRLRIAILGSVGVPARYGGFETLAQNIVRFHAREMGEDLLSVYCSRPAYPDGPDRLGRATLRYSRLRANGVSSIFYDATTLRDAVNRGVDMALLLGVSGAVALPVLARHGTKIVTHLDGLESHRGKWSAPARAFLRWSERLAVRHSDALIADSPVIAERVRSQYGRVAEVIAYGGDHATDAPDAPCAVPHRLPAGYTLALCRIEPENNVQMILEAGALAQVPLVFVGNWSASAYGRTLQARYRTEPNMRLLDPIFDAGPLHALRHGAARYVHGHSAGGTNPSLVEMMHVGHPIVAFDCDFNRYTTRDRALYFKDAPSLAALLTQPPVPNPDLRDIALAEYTWDKVGAQYFALFRRLAER